MKSLSLILPWAQFLFTEPKVSYLIPNIVTALRSEATTKASELGLDVNTSYVMFGIYVSRPSISFWADFDTLADYLDRTFVTSPLGSAGSAPVIPVPYLWKRLYWWPEGISPRRFNTSIPTYGTKNLDYLALENTIYK